MTTTVGTTPTSTTTPNNGHTTNRYEAFNEDDDDDDDGAEIIFTQDSSVFTNRTIDNQENQITPTTFTPLPPSTPPHRD